ncbi:hypothetical protein B0H13DRAFT_2496627 [Mycena leptocephala]|nr:hypothetical protein B0H13DRAFT_2496627 [Mycena leptocephala]
MIRRSAAERLRRVGSCFGPPAVECVRADHGGPDIPPDRPPTQNHLYLEIQGVFRRFWPPAAERVHADHVDTGSVPDTKPLLYRRFGRSVAERMDAVHVGAASPPDQYPTQNLNYLGAIGYPPPNACTSTTSAPTSRRTVPDPNPFVLRCWDAVFVIAKSVHPQRRGTSASVLGGAPVPRARFRVPCNVGSYSDDYLRILYLDFWSVVTEK